MMAAGTAGSTPGLDGYRSTFDPEGLPIDEDVCNLSSRLLDYPIEGLS